MDFVYTAYTEDRKIVKGKVSSISEEAATELLGYGGYRVINLKKVVPLFDTEKLLARFSRIKPPEIVMFSRQLALLLESGTDIVTSLDLLQDQIANQALRGIIAEVSSDIRGGSPLSKALSKHPRAFSPMYSQAISAGEQGGNLEVVLRQMADYLERGATTEKKIKGALTYPFIVVLVAVIVVAILMTFVFPSFVSFYAQIGAELPLATRMLISITDWFSHYGLYLIIVILAVVGLIYVYIKTPAGKYRWHKMMLRLPVVGRIVQLSELSRCCRTMSLLIRVGLPLPEVLAATVRGINNKAVEESLSEVQQALIRGEGLAQPMGQRDIFLPLMTQMVRVGEETGNLENTLVTVAESFETEANDKTNAAIGLIQPVITVFLGLVIGFVVLAMLSAMYSVYGQLNL
jgi:type IV pilus assembly protein PilC